MKYRPIRLQKEYKDIIIDSYTKNNKYILIYYILPDDILDAIEFEFEPDEDKKGYIFVQCKYDESKIVNDSLVISKINEYNNLNNHAEYIDYTLGFVNDDFIRSKQTIKIQYRFK